MIFVACKDNTWVLDEDQNRCLKLFTDKKDWEDANEHCQTEGSTLVKIAPTVTDKLKGIFKNNMYQSFNLFC